MCVLLVGSAGWAHDADVIFVLAESRDSQVSETVTLTASTLGQLAPVDADENHELTQSDLDARGDAIRAGVWQQMPLTSQGGVPCQRAATESARLREGFVELHAELTCGLGELRQDFRILSVLPANYRVVLGSQLDADVTRSFAQGTLTSLTVPRTTGLPSGRSGSMAQEGFARLFTLEALACLVLLSITVTSWRAAVFGALALLLGSLISLPAAWAGPLLLGLGAVLCVVLRASKRVGLVSALAALGLASNVGTAAGLERLAHFGGALLALALIVTPSVLVGRMLRRRPVWLFRAQLALMTAALFSAAFQLW